VPMNQSGQSRFRISVGVFLHQIHVVRIRHQLIIGRKM
jgi:hypothetical protein